MEKLLLSFQALLFRKKVISTDYGKNLPRIKKFLMS